MTSIQVRKGMPDAKLSREQFERRMRARYYDPAFDRLASEVDKIIEAAWDAYSHSRKSPRTQKAGPGYADPDYDLSVEWIAARKAVEAAQSLYEDATTPSSILLINGAMRSEHTCPSEMSKTYRLLTLARETIEQESGIEVELLDLSRLVSERDLNIYPCKTCVSTAMPLCHWPCTGYPNHSLAQVNDWMNDIYPMWVRAHGIMIVAPVNWYMASSGLKLMMDRLVCADGGNSDPTSTKGKDAVRAKQIELDGWPYPRHLAGRVFSVITHADSTGVTALADMLSDWLSDMGLVEAGHFANLSRYVGYMKPYATSHDDLDRDEALHEEVRNAARTLVEAVAMMRRGEMKQPGRKLREPRPK
jgi:multimeric flavodoxin WrbA